MRQLTPGTVVGVRSALVTHYGIFTERETVITSSPALRKVAEISLTAFLGGKDLQVVGYPGSQSPYTVVSRARQMLGRRYDLFQFNCEHLYRSAHGLNEESPQIRIAALIVVAALAWLALRKA